MSEDKTDELVAIIERWQREAVAVVRDAIIAADNGVHPNDLVAAASPVEQALLASFFAWYAITYPDEKPSTAIH